MQFATIVTITRASRALTSSERASSSEGETKTGTRTTPERFNSPSAIYQLDLREDEKQVTKWYNALSGSYDKLYGEEQSRKHQTVLVFLGDRRFKVLVDIGCGTGTFLRQAEKNYDYGIGVDLSTKMLRIAKAKKTPNTDYVLASSSSLPLRADSSDCTVCISTAKAEPNLSTFIHSLERIGHKDSFLAFTLFQQPGAPKVVALSNPVRSTTISEREILYFYSSGRPPE